MFFPLLMINGLFFGEINFGFFFWCFLFLPFANLNPDGTMQQNCDEPGKKNKTKNLLNKNRCYLVPPRQLLIHLMPDASYWNGGEPLRLSPNQTITLDEDTSATLVCLSEGGKCIWIFLLPFGSNFFLCLL